MDGDLSDLQPLSPLHFFQFQLSCQRLPAGKKSPILPQLSDSERKRFLLPHLASVSGEEEFAEIWLGWQPEGWECLARVTVPYQRVSYPNISKGDSLELFIDTRDLKNVGTVTRFCHHFFFLPEAVEGEQKGEITHFRGEERHDLCEAGSLFLQAKQTKQGYELAIRIPTECLHGFDPDQCERVGFTYRLNRASGNPQHFNVSGEEYSFEQQPALWSSLKLEKT